MTLYRMTCSQHINIPSNKTIFLIKKNSFNRAAKEEILALSHIAEQINSKFNGPSETSNMNGHTNLISTNHQLSNESVDLDNLFAFLSEVNPNSNNSSAIIDEIGEKMNSLVEDLDMELESVIQQEIEGLAMERPSKTKGIG